MSPDAQKANLDLVMILVGGAGTISVGLLAWGLKVLISTVLQNTFAIKLLTQKIEGLLAGHEKLPKMEQDIHEAHRKIRELIPKGREV